MRKKLWFFCSVNLPICPITNFPLKPKSCLTWHTDNTTRIHYPIKTQEGCFMVIADEVKYLETNIWYHTNTLSTHSAFNGSKDERLHLVVNLIDEKF